MTTVKLDKEDCIVSRDEKNDPLLQIRNLAMHVARGDEVVRAVDGIDLDVGRGEIVGLVGESGSGKTMTCRSIMGLLPQGGTVLHGEIRFKARDLVQASDRDMRDIRGREIGIIFQNPSSFLNPVMRVGTQIVESVMLHHGKTRQEAKDEVIQLLLSLGLPGPAAVFDYYPHQLSGGMRQRVMIAMAVACRPDLLIGDECTTELDVTTQLQILKLLKESVLSTGSSLLLVTHNLGVVAYMCDTVYVMYAGKVVESASVYDLFDDPRHPYTVGLLKSTLSIEEGSGKPVSIKGSVADLANPPPGCRFHPRCPSAMEQCKNVMPESTAVGKRHTVSCFLYG